MEDAGQAVHEIVAQYAAEHAQGHAIQLAQRYATMGVQTNALDASVPARMTARQDAKQIVCLHVQQIVQIHALIALADVAVAVMQLVRMIVLVGAREDAIRPAPIIV